MNKIKLNLFLSLIFALVSSFSAVHQAQHIQGDHHNSNCMICVIAKNIVSDDAIEFLEQAIKVHFDKIDDVFVQNYLDFKPSSTKNRDPPHLFS